MPIKSFYVKGKWRTKEQIAKFLTDNHIINIALDLYMPYHMAVGYRNAFKRWLQGLPPVSELDKTIYSKHFNVQEFEECIDTSGNKLNLRGVKLTLKELEAAIEKAPKFWTSKMSFEVETPFVKLKKKDLAEALERIAGGEKNFSLGKNNFQQWGDKKLKINEDIVMLKNAKSALKLDHKKVSVQALGKSSTIPVFKVKKADPGVGEFGFGRQRLVVSAVGNLLVAKSPHWGMEKTTGGKPELLYKQTFPGLMLRPFGLVKDKNNEFMLELQADSHLFSYLGWEGLSEHVKHLVQRDPNRAHKIAISALDLIEKIEEKKLYDKHEIRPEHFFVLGDKVLFTDVFPKKSEKDHKEYYNYLREVVVDAFGKKFISDALKRPRSKRAKRIRKSVRHLI